MADSEVFEQVCGELERATSLNRLEVRGTVRIALRDAGLDSRSVRPDQMTVVLQKVLPAALASRGIADGERACSAIVRALLSAPAGAAHESPEDIFRRLGGGA